MGMNHAVEDPWGYPELSKAEVGFEPTNHGFAIRSLRPLGYSANEQAGYSSFVRIAIQCKSLLIMPPRIHTEQGYNCYPSRPIINGDQTMIESIFMLTFSATMSGQDGPTEARRNLACGLQGGVIQPTLYNEQLVTFTQTIGDVLCL